MDYLRCPHLDRLGREPIEAYRYAGDTDLFCLPNDLDGPGAISNVHRKMAEHRKSCHLCAQVERNGLISQQPVVSWPPGRHDRQ